MAAADTPSPSPPSRRPSLRPTHPRLFRLLDCLSLSLDASAHRPSRRNRSVNAILDSHREHSLPKLTLEVVCVRKAIDTPYPRGLTPGGWFNFRPRGGPLASSILPPATKRPSVRLTSGRPTTSEPSRPLERTGGHQGVSQCSLDHGGWPLLWTRSTSRYSLNTPPTLHGPATRPTHRPTRRQ